MVMAKSDSQENALRKDQNSILQINYGPALRDSIILTKVKGKASFYVSIMHL